MRKSLALFALVLSLGLAAVTDAEAARRLGGGMSKGMQRTPPATTPHQAPTQAPPQTPQQAPAVAPTNAGAPAAAAAPAHRSRWLGPIAGLAAGLGLAALASHLGFGEAFANILMIGLLVLVAFAVIGMIMRRRAGPTPAAAGGAPFQDRGGFGNDTVQERAAIGADAAAPRTGSLIGSRIGVGMPAAAPAGAVAQYPAGFDADAFARTAKQNFLQLQAANDARDLERLRDFLTPELLEDIRRDFSERDATPQKTEVFGLDAQVLQVVEDGAHYVASVRFTGTIRHEAGAVPEDFDELWHLVKPRAGSGGWMLAGIQQAF
jgi:predicted lipid-binding transport protein (Tim44 family)